MAPSHWRDENQGKYQPLHYKTGQNDVMNQVRLSLRPFKRVVFELNQPYEHFEIPLRRLACCPSTQPSQLRARIGIGGCCRKRVSVESHFQVLGIVTEPNTVAYTKGASYTTRRDRNLKWGGLFMSGVTLCDGLCQLRCGRPDAAGRRKTPTSEEV